MPHSLERIFTSTTKAEMPQIPIIRRESPSLPKLFMTILIACVTKFMEQIYYIESKLVLVLSDKP